MVERVLEAHPSVAEAAVFGVPDAHWGESVKAAVVLRDDSGASREDLLDWCRARLGGFQQPRSIEVLNYLPRTTTGKVLKRVLRDAYWTDQTRRVGAA
jgi:acyl-CoA synthetase (AMP-forming)/AMP-acid ligase II